MNSLPSPFSTPSPLQVTLLLVVNNALQGILSSFFFKFADTILKKYSSTIATIFTGIMSAALFGHALTLNFCLGVSIVFISMHIFFSTGAGSAAAPRAQPNAAKLTVGRGAMEGAGREASCDHVGSSSFASSSES